MHLQSLPTGTISSERLGSRTFPPDDAPGDHGPPRSQSHPDSTTSSYRLIDAPDDRPSNGPRPRSCADGSGVVPADGHPRGTWQGSAGTDGASPRPPASRTRAAHGSSNGAASASPTARVAQLERENAALRAELTERERELQDVIDRYERLLAQRNEPLRRSNRAQVKAVKSTSPGLLTRLAAWLVP